MKDERSKWRNNGATATNNLKGRSKHTDGRETGKLTKTDLQIQKQICRCIDRKETEMETETETINVQIQRQTMNE